MGTRKEEEEMGMTPDEHFTRSFLGSLNRKLKSETLT